MIFRFSKFCLVGLSGVGVSMGSLWLFTEVAGLFYVISAAFSHILSVTSNFSLNQIWTFDDRQTGFHFSTIIKRWLKYFISTLAALGVFLAIITLLTEVFGLYYLFSALCAIAISSPVNFLLSNYWVWKLPSNERKISFS